jgi:hypothetical protein
MARMSWFSKIWPPLPCSPQGNIHHGPRQLVGPNHLVGEERSKRGVDRAQEAIAEILVPSAAPQGKCTRAGRCKGAGTPPRVVRSRPFPYSVRKASGSVRSGPRHSHSRMRVQRRGCWRGERARTRSGSPRLSSGVPRPTLLRYMRPGKRPLRPDRRAPPPVGSSPRSLGAQPRSTWDAKCRHISQLFREIWPLFDCTLFAHSSHIMTC